jgi:outer membrane receptor protein involved in Fe transport
MKHLFSTIFIFICLIAKAQLNTGTVSGTVVDSITKNPLEYATVILQNLTDSSVSGGLTDEKGKFIIERVKPGVYALEITFLGYNNFKTPKFNLYPPDMQMNMGVIKIGEQTELLDIVTIVGEQNLIQLGNEKKVFNVDKSPLASNANLSGILRQIPSVDVDNEGKLTLRGSENVIVYINGKPSGIAGNSTSAILESFPASSIESIELITNPSAKYEAQGGAGIINIILKKNADKGFNGNIGVGFSTLYSTNANLGINYRNKKIIFSTNYAIRSTDGFNEGNGNRQNFLGDTSSYYINNVDRTDNYGVGNTLTSTLDYNLNEKNNFNVSTVLSQGWTRSNSNNNFYFLDNEQDLQEHRQRIGDRKIDKNYGAEINVNWLNKLAKPKEEVSMGITYSYNNSGENGRYIENELINNSLIVKENILNNRINHLATAQVDYSYPVKNTGKFDVGAKTNFRDFNFSLNADSLNRLTQIYEAELGRNNGIHYQESVTGAYTNYNGAYKDLSYRAGFRTEYTHLNISQNVGNLNNNYGYLGYFPSAGLSYKFNKTNDIAINYSRRINRPSPFALNPFADYSDPYNLRIGNPNLKPEYNNSYEITYSRSIKTYYVSATGYFKNILNNVTRTRTVNEDGIAVVQTQNMKLTRNYGLDINARLGFTKWWTMLPNVNIYYYQSTGTVPEQSDDRNVDAFTYTIRLINNFSFWKNANLQLVYFVRGPMDFLQGRIVAMHSLSLGFKKDFMKNNKGTIALNVYDFAHTQKFALSVGDYNYQSDVERRWKSLFGNITFTYRFGKSDVKAAQQKRKDDAGSMQDIGM